MSWNGDLPNTYTVSFPTMYLPATIWSRVVLPAPLAPTSRQRLPLGKCKEQSLTKASQAGYEKVTWFRSTAESLRLAISAGIVVSFQREFGMCVAVIGMYRLVSAKSCTRCKWEVHIRLHLGCGSGFYPTRLFISPHTELCWSISLCSAAISVGRILSRMSAHMISSVSSSRSLSSSFRPIQSHLQAALPVPSSTQVCLIVHY